MPTPVTIEQCSHNVEKLTDYIRSSHDVLEQKLDIIVEKQAKQAVHIAEIKTAMAEREKVRRPHIIAGGIACVLAVVVVWLKQKLLGV